MSLSARQRAMLDFERNWWTRPEPKHVAIRRVLALSSSHYYRLLADLIQTDDAIGYDPMLVRRLRRQRNHRRRVRLVGPPARQRPS
ncbi:MAG: DUF3263 domain-containing protein [Acidimicrobiales bacterium]